MAHFYERIQSKRINYYDETNKIDNVFTKEEFYSYALGEHVSLAEFIDLLLFRKLDLSGNYISIFDVVEDIKNQQPADSFIEYSELILSLSIQIEVEDLTSATDKASFADKISCLIKIIEYDLDAINLQYDFIDSEIGRVAIVRPKDPLVEEALENITDTNLISNLILYKSVKLEGDIKSKESVLYHLGKYIEPTLKDNHLFQLNKRLYEDVGFMLNNLDLRHNNVDTNNKQYYQATLNDREKWLDKLFFEILLVINSNKENAIHIDIDKLKH